MTRNGLPAVPLAMPTQRETKTFMPAVVPTGTSRLKPGPSRPPSIQIGLIFGPRPAERPHRMGRYPVAKPHPNPKSP